MQHLSPLVRPTPFPGDRGVSAAHQPSGLGGLQGVPAKPLRYFIYCRKSSEGEERQTLSIPSQDRELQRIFLDREALQVVGRFEEEQSAKRPGRPIFNAMMERIVAGEAEGIIAYTPDRLARNSLDGGRLIYMLDTGALKDLKFATYTFENNTQGKFMLQVLFAQSKQYSDNLSDLIHRTIQTKLEMGWWPNKAPPGYLNNHRERTIEIDPHRAPLIRQMFMLAQSGVRPAEICRRANEEWGFRTPKGPKSGDRPLAVSAVYKLLSNPFYTGVMVWGGQTYQGRHEPLVSIAVFARVQALLHGRQWQRPQKQIFPYTGLIRCGECGHMITAEHKTNRYGSRYTYYHCSKKALPRCPQPSISAAELERQISAFLSSLCVEPGAQVNVLAIVAENDHAVRAYEAARIASLEKAARSVEGQLRELTGLRLRQLVTDCQFLAEQSRLELERRTIAENLATKPNPTGWIEPLENLFMFSNKAAEWMKTADEAKKREILKKAGSNPVLMDKKLIIQAARPFVQMRRLSEITELLGVKEEVRTGNGFSPRTRNRILRIARSIIQTLEEVDRLGRG